MTWEQEQEQEYRQEQIKERQRLETAILNGRDWAIVLNKMQSFIDAQKAAVIDSLEMGRYANDYEVHALLSKLQVIRNFRDIALRFIQDGQLAERRMANGDTDDEE